MRSRSANAFLAEPAAQRFDITGGPPRMSGRATPLASDGVEIDMTPMLDTAFVLLLFFIIISTPTFQHGLDVSLAGASSAARIESAQAIISIDAAGQVSLQHDQVELSDLAAKLKSQAQEGKIASIVLRADGSVTHQRVVDVLDAVARSGITDVKLATRAIETGR